MLSGSILCSLLTLAACPDDPGLARVNPAIGRAKFTTTIVCAVETAAARTWCREIVDSGSDHLHVPMSIVQKGEVIAETEGDSYTRSDSTYRVRVRVRNTSGSALGTYDGAPGTGIWAFLPVNAVGYHEPRPADEESHGAFLAPSLPNGVQSVRARNHDGGMAFTAPDQPFWHYPGVVEDGDATEWREWHFTVDPEVAYFYFAVLVFAPTPGEEAVPVRVPEAWTEPARYLGRDALQNCSSVTVVGRCIPDALVIMFARSATQLERQVAIEAVGGVLEGGHPATNSYYVRIPADPEFNYLTSALRRLRQLPQVRLVVPYGPLPMGPSHVRPNDGNRWNQWQVIDSLEAGGRNWALEAISAPLAWGCDTGRVALQVAVVDTDFHLGSDLNTTLVPANPLVGTLTAAADSGDHGTKVSAIIAARGNNGGGMTGVMWDARVRLYEVARDSAGGIVRRNGQVEIGDLHSLSAIGKAARDGNSVINVSLGFNWRQWAHSKGYSDWQTYNPGTVSDSIRIQQRDETMALVSGRFVDALIEIADAGHKPLIVLAAGNDAWSATWNPYTHVPSELRDNLIVVGAARRVSRGVLALAPFSSRGDTVDIVAPGAGVWTLNRNGAVSASGTSVAAPYVTGVAGLIVSFDPRLATHGDSLKQLILAGAVNGGRTVSGGLGGGNLPVLHAYEALKAAAQRRSAPLCGNRLWTAGGTGPVLIGRAGTPDTIISSTATSYDFASYHFGGAVRVPRTNGWIHRYHPSGWQPAPVLPTDSAKLSGVSFSSQQRSHGGDTLLIVDILRSGEQPTHARVMRQVQAGAAQTITDVPLPPLSTASTEVCLAGGRPAFEEDGWECWDVGYTGLSEVPSVLPLYSPSGEFVYLLLKVQGQRSFVKETFPCAGGTCSRLGSHVYSFNTRAYRIRLSNGQHSLLWTHPGEAMVAVLSERGNEMGIVFGEYEWGEEVPTTGSCHVMFLRANTGVATYNGPDCGTDPISGRGWAGFAP